MKKLVFFLAVCGLVFANSNVMRLHEASYKMDWEMAVEYCRSLDAHVPTLNTLKAAYERSYRGSGGEKPYKDDSYWSADQFDIDGGYVFDFSAGLHRVEYKGKLFRVMCIQMVEEN